MKLTPTRCPLLTRLFVAAAAVFVCIGFTSSAVAVTLSEGKHVPTPGNLVGAVSNDGGVLIASWLVEPFRQLIFDYVPLIGTPTRHIVTPVPFLGYIVSTGTNGQEFLAVHHDEDAPKAILFDATGVPIRTVTLPAFDRQWSAFVIRATEAGFDVYDHDDQSIRRTSVRLDGTTSATWQTVATFDKEIGFFDVLDLAHGKVLIYLAEHIFCRFDPCQSVDLPVYAAVTTRDDLVHPFEFAELPEATTYPDAEAGSGGRIWLLAGKWWEMSTTEVRELVAPPGAPIAQSRVLATDPDGPGSEYSFAHLTRFGSGFVITERAPGGDAASLRSRDGYEWLRVPISSGDAHVFAAVPGPGARVSFIVQNYWNKQETYVRFLSLGRSRGASPVEVKRVRPSRPE